MPDILIIPQRGTSNNPSIHFTGSSAANIKMEVLPAGGVAYIGTSGSLFNITDNLIGSLMSVGDVSGLPILEVFSDDRVVMGKYNANTLYVSGTRVGVGKVPLNAILDVTGSAVISGSLAISGSGVTFINRGTTTFSGVVNSLITSNAFNIYGPLSTNIGAGTSDAIVDIGVGRTGDGNAYLNFVSDSSTYTSYSLLVARLSGTNGKSQLIHRGTGDFEIKANEAGAISLQTSGTEKVRILSGGNVGIGATPSAKLSVNGISNFGDLSSGMYNTNSTIHIAGPTIAQISFEHIGSSTSGIVASTTTLSFAHQNSSPSYNFKYSSTYNGNFASTGTTFVSFNPTTSYLNVTNVGVGKTTANAALDVNGSIISTGSLYISGGANYVQIGGYPNANAYNSTTGAKLLFGGSDADALGNYYIGTNQENYGGNYNKLDLRWHTGIRMGAQPGYGGIRFYDSEDLGTVIFSVGQDDANVRVKNSMSVGKVNAPNATLDVNGNMVVSGSIITNATDILINNNVPFGKGGGSGTNNIRAGTFALNNLTTGQENTAVGGASGQYITTGNSNSFFGYFAGGNANPNTGYSNVGIGQFALANVTSGAENVVIGQNSGYDITSGVSNVILGRNTGRGITTGGQNVVIGNGVTGLSSGLTGTIILADGGGTIRLYIKNDGNVGIGQTSPAYKLDVTGDIRATGTLRISTGNTTGGGIVLADDGDIVDLNDGWASHRFSYGLRIYSANGGGSTVIQLANSAGGNSYINTTGNFGIGTASPTAKLEVAGDVMADNVLNPFLLMGA